jgi:hypothetical protein
MCLGDRDHGFHTGHPQYRGEAWPIHASVRRVEADGEDGGVAGEDGTVLGVDLGTDDIAVASTGRFRSAGGSDRRCRGWHERR